MSDIWRNGVFSFMFFFFKFTPTRSTLPSGRCIFSPTVYTFLKHKYIIMIQFKQAANIRLIFLFHQVSWRNLNGPFQKNPNKGGSGGVVSGHTIFRGIEKEHTKTPGASGKRSRVTKGETISLPLLPISVTGLFQKDSKTPSRWVVEDIEFPGLLKREHAEIPSIN